MKTATHQDIRDAFKSFPEDSWKMLNDAYDLATRAHIEQIRDSGEPYIIHPCEVAWYLIDLGMDAKTVAAGLMHDVLEDTDITYEQMVAEFGEEVAMLVDGVSKLTHMDFYSREEMQAENLRKMFMAMAKDIRVIIIKLADRLHNMRTLQYCEVDKQQRTAKETLNIYAPLAHRLGIFQIKWELEDLSFLYLDPQGYKDVAEKVALTRVEREEVVGTIIESLRKIVEDELKIEAEIEGRPKHLYSIYKKMQTRAFEQIYDLTAIRIIVDTVRDCYAVLGAVHTLWRPIPGRFKDYIAMPKTNMYQSLHTTMMGHNGIPFEIQIRTWEMHRTAEYGIAAHWKYKEGRSSDTSLDRRLSWLRQLMEEQDEVSDPSEFIRALQSELVTDQVYVFTPKGDVKELPLGATPLDFAYSIHSEIGHKCTGARINGKMVPLDRKLKSGDIVEILTSASAKGPSRDWLNIVQTSAAKNRIRSWLKKEFKEENITKGREMLENAAKRQGYHLSQLMRHEWVDALLKRYTLNNTEDLYAAVGFGGVSTGQVLSRLVEQYKKLHKADDPPEQVKEKPGETEKPKPQARKKDSHGIVVKGEEGMLVRLSHCCNPVPGDDIIGYITRGRGVSVHRSDCTNLKDLAIEPERIIDVAWEDAEAKDYVAEVQIVAVDRDALLADLINAITRMGMPLMGVNARVNPRTGLANVGLMLQISDTQQLERVIKQLLKLPEVVEAFRVGA